MRVLDPTIVAALADYHIEANAVDLTAGGVTFRFSNWPDGVVVGGQTYPAVAGFAILSPPAYADSALSEASLQLPDPDGALAALHVAKALIGAPVNLYNMLAAQGGVLTPDLAFAGTVEEVTGVVKGYIGIRVGPLMATSVSLVPEIFSPYCHKYSTDPVAIAAGHGCSFAATCAHNYAACVANGQQVTYGGDLHLCPAGYLIEFRGSGSTVGTSGGGNSGNPGIVVVS